MHREIQIKQFPIVTTHWWPKTRNERFVWENEQYLYRFFTSCTQPCPSDLSAHTHPVCVCVCVTCVCARSGSRCIHTGRRRQRLTEGVSEAWCWRAVIVTTTNHILLWCCMNGIGYLHEAIWLADASVGAWSWKVFNFCRKQRQWSDATDPQFSSATLDVTPFKVNERRWRRRPVWMGRQAPEVISRAYTSLIARARAHTSHTGCVCALRSLGHGCVQEVKNDINTVGFLTQTARFVS